MQIRTFAICLTMALLSGCAYQAATPVTDRNSELTHGNVEMNIQVGATTQAEVVDAFGAPNVTTLDAEGNEVWTYQRAAQVSQSSTSDQFWSIIIAGGGRQSSGFESTQRTITLIIHFNENDVVSDVRSRSSNF